MDNKLLSPLNLSGKECQQIKCKNLITSSVLVLFILLSSVGCIQPSRPIIVSPNTQSSPSNFIFNFILQKELQSTGYLLINFSPLTSDVTPKSCIMVNTSSASSLSISKCINLQDGSLGALTVNKTWINQINPNIIATKTIAVQFTQNLAPTTDYSIQIITENVLPAIGTITSNFELYTISGTGFMLEENWNFGQVFFQYRQNNILNVNSINDLTQNLPGTLSSNLQFQITISVKCPTPYSVIKFVISGNFQFSVSSLINVQGASSTAPQVISTTIVSPNIIVTKFGESFSPARKFKVSITDIKNPLEISSGFVSVYYLPDNSMSPLQIKQLAILIGTKRYVPTITVLTGQALTAVSPIQFYQLKQQYLTVTIILPRQCDNNFIIEILTETLAIHQGTVYAKASTALASNLKYDHYIEEGVRISGFPVIPSGSKITVTMKVWIPTTPSFNIKVSIDQSSRLSNPIIHGSAPTVDTVVSTQFVTLFTGNQGQANKLSSMISATGSPYSSILFTVKPNVLTQVGSSLSIYTCQNLIKAATFSAATSCLVNNVVRTCSITTNDTVTLIKISSGSSNNLFIWNLPTTVKVNDLSFRYLSSNTEYIYQFYFQITSSQSSTNAIILKTVHTPQVIAQRPAPVVNTGFTNYFSNDLNNTGTNYPNIFRIVSTDSSKWNYIIQTTQKRMITVFHKQKWTRLFMLRSGDEHPFLSSLPGVKSTFIQGTTFNTSQEYPLNWDQIHFILPGTQNTTTFSITIPLTYTTSNQFNFELMSGIYNTETRVITYRQVQVKPQPGSRTYKLFSTPVPVSAKPKQSSMKIKLAGNAGSYKSGVQVVVTPASGAFNADSFSAGLIVTSTWKWFDETTTISAANVSVASPYPTFLNDFHQKPLSLKLGQQSYLTFIPFRTSAAYPSSFSVFFDNVKFPYTHDLPYYSILLIDGTGSVDSYNQFINQDQGVFYQTYLKKITLTCSDNSLGVTNTDCSIGFIPNHQIQIYSKIYVTFTGLKVSTNKCVLTKISDSSQISNQCSSNTDKNQLIVTLKNSARLQALTQYTLKIYGMSIDTDTIIHHTEMSLRDSSGGYIIQAGKKILMTSVSSYFPIYIQQITYLKNNPIVVSGFNIIFQLPRKLNQDQAFVVVMGNDLSNLNNVPSKLRIRLYYHSNSTQITNVRWFLNTKKYQIIFQGLHNVLDVMKYRLQIYGMKTPSTIDQNIISLIYLRTFDNSYTVQNTPSSTASFPSLVDKVNSLITLRPYFNTEGMEQPLQFNITGQYAKVDADTVWYITLPRYYSQSIWNQDFLAYCAINNTRLECGRHQNLPYTIVIKKSPKAIDVGSWYILSVHGVTCPRGLYVNSNPTYVTQSLFFGISTNQTSQSYIQYSQLYMTQTIRNPQQTPGTTPVYGTITVKQIVSSNSQTFQTTFFSIMLVSTVSIVPTDYLFLTFPEGFDNFNDLQMQGQIVVGTSKKTFTATVVNTKIGLAVPPGITVPANTLFSIQISSLPTPKSTINIDMNKIFVTLTPEAKTSTKASSLQLHNQVSSKDFATTELHLLINNYQSIQLTAGTYSNSIKMQPSDRNPFKSNIRVQFVTNSFIFQPNPASLYLGDSYGQFRIGAEQTLIPTKYTFEIIKSQSSISAFYTALSKYSVSVSNNPISVSLPTLINVPKGGCSIPFKIKLLNAPFLDLNIDFQYDSDIFTLDQFWINQQISYNQLTFSSVITYRWLSFCCASTFAALSVPVSIYLGGTNQRAYKLSTDNFVVNVIANTTTIAQPVMSLTVVNTQKTYAKLKANTNLNGFIYYELKLSPLRSPLDLIELKYQIKQKNLTREQQADFLNKQIYTSDRDHRIDFIPAFSGDNNIQFQDLLPQRQYTFCAYFQNQHRVTTQGLCQTFTMQTWGPIKKVYIKFKQVIFQNQLNNILCYFARASNSQINQIVSLQGKSCSLNNSASNYYFTYNGEVRTNQLSSTIIYHVSDHNLTTDPSSSAFSSLYDINGISSNSLATALANFSISYINSSRSLGSFNPMDNIKLSSDASKPQLSFTAESFTKGSDTLYLRNLRLSKPGSVYLVLTPYKKMIKDQIAGHTDIQIRPLVIPTYQQVLNCKDGYDVSALSCQRIVLKQDQQIDVKFTGVAQNRMYAVFYLVTNQYPLRPVVYGSVQKQQMTTVVLFSPTLISSLGLLTVLIIAVVL